jgi:hypothetical protein
LTITSSAIKKLNWATGFSQPFVKNPVYPSANLSKIFSSSPTGNGVEDTYDTIIEKKVVLKNNFIFIVEKEKECDLQV